MNITQFKKVLIVAADWNKSKNLVAISYFLADLENFVELKSNDIITNVVNDAYKYNGIKTEADNCGEFEIILELLKIIDKDTLIVTQNTIAKELLEYKFNYYNNLIKYKNIKNLTFYSFNITNKKILKKLEKEMEKEENDDDLELDLDLDLDTDFALDINITNIKLNELKKDFYYIYTCKIKELAHELFLNNDSNDEEEIPF